MTLKEFNKLAAVHGLHLTKYYGYFAWGFTDPDRREDYPPTVCVKHFKHLKKEHWMFELEDAIKFLKEEK